MADEITYDSTKPVRSQASATYTPTGLSDQNNLNAYNANREQKIQNTYNAALNNTNAGLKTAYDQNLSDLQAARDKISPQYQQSANALAAEYERQKRNNNMQGAANGLNTGAGSQLALGQSMAYQRDAGNLARSENEALNEANRGIADLGVQYQNQIAQAVAANDYKQAQAMLDEYERQYQRQMTLENQNYQRQQQAEQQAYQRALNEENRDYTRAYDIENRDYNRNWNLENRDYDRAWNEDDRAYTRGWNQDERDYNRAWNEENRNYSRYWDEDDRMYNRLASEDERNYNRAYNEENRDYTRAFNEENRDYTRAYNEENRDFGRAWDLENRDYTRDWNQNDRDYTRAYNEENRDYTRAFNEDERDYTRAWNQDERSYDRTMTEAANRAEYGDFSGYASIYGQGIADAMRDVWVAQNPMVAYSTGAITADEYMMLTGKYPYNSSGSSGSSYGGYRSGGGGGYGGGGGTTSTATDTSQGANVTFNGVVNAIAQGYSLDQIKAASANPQLAEDLYVTAVSGRSNIAPARGGSRSVGGELARAAASSTAQPVSNTANALAQAAAAKYQADGMKRTNAAK